jgi:hypothetical protein
MSEAVTEYLVITRQILELRKHSYADIEEVLLQKLDNLWNSMDEEEQSKADSSIAKLTF